MMQVLQCPIYVIIDNDRFGFIIVYDMFHLISDLFNGFHFNWTTCFVGLKQLGGLQCCSVSPFRWIKAEKILEVKCSKKFGWHLQYSRTTWDFPMDFS